MLRLLIFRVLLAGLGLFVTVTSQEIFTLSSHVDLLLLSLQHPKWQEKLSMRWIALLSKVMRLRLFLHRSDAKLPMKCVVALLMLTEMTLARREKTGGAAVAVAVAVALAVSGVHPLSRDISSVKEIEIKTEETRILECGMIVEVVEFFVKKLASRSKYVMDKGLNYVKNELKSCPFYSKYNGFERQ